MGPDAPPEALLRVIADRTELRGLGRVEFEGFRVPMEESRGRFVESAEMILRGLEDGYCEYDGTYVKQPRKAIRPAPARSGRRLLPA